jgi:hypothetical protein
MAELDHINDIDNNVVYDLKDKTARQTITENEIYFRKMFCVHMGNAGGAEQIPGYGWYNNVDITLTSIIGAFDVSGMDGAFLRIIFRESPHYDYTLPIIIRAFESDYHREVFCHVYTDTNKTEELKITGTETIDFIYDKVNRCFFVVGRSSTGDLANYYTKSQTDNLLNAKANAADLSAVATSGDYNDLSNLPTIPSGQVQSDWAQTDSSEVDYIKNKPTIPAGQVNSDWNSSSGASEILNKPNLAAVATTGSYNDLVGKPSIPSGQVQSDWNQTNTSEVDYIKNKPAIPAAQVNSDWNAASGVAQILNKPNLAAVATSGSYNDLADKPTIPSGQVQSDWNQSNSSAVDYIKNKPTIPAAQVPSDWNATTGVSRILNKPSLSEVATSGDYNDLENLPTIPAAQVPSDWNATAGVARILNKPNLSDVATSGNYSDLNGAPTLAPVATSGDYDDLSNKPDLSVLQYLANIAAADDFNPGTSYSYLDFVKYNDRLYICKSLSGSTAGPFDPTEWNEIIIGEQVAQAQRTFLLATRNENRLDNLATVATSGNYNDLNGTPAIPAAQVNSDWNAMGTVAEILNKPNLSAVANSGLYADLIGAPTLAPVATSGAYSDLNGTPTLATVATSGDYGDLLNTPDLTTKQDTLVSGSNIKTVNGTSLLGSGNLETASLQTVADTGNKSVPNNTITKISEIRLTKGLWIITATIGFANTSTNNDRVAIFSTAAASSVISNFESYCRIRAAATSWTDIPMSCIYNATSSTSLYLYGLQDSGITLNSRCFGIRAAKIA